MSSPIVYPNSLSPPRVSPRKKRKIELADREPLLPVATNSQNKVVASFVLDGSDDEANVQDVDVVNGRAKPVPKTRLKRDEDEHVRDKVESSDKPSQIKPCSSKSQSVGSQQPPTASLRTEAWIKCSSGKAIAARQKPRNRTPLHQHALGPRPKSPGASAFSPRVFYGIEIHKLIEEASNSTHYEKLVTSEAESQVSRSMEHSLATDERKSKHTRMLMWTEKYRARKFTDLIGDERTHRSVLKWLKSWDTTVFPIARGRGKQKFVSDTNASEFSHKKVLLLTGAPGLGKTTLAHVCARQAGYEVQEINASDERSRDVVKGKIRDMVGTENVRQIETTLGDKGCKVARPVCVVVDEVDGVAVGTGGGEGGFIKALADLLVLDQKNANKAGSGNQESETRLKKRKGDQFRLLRPLILICNDVYHPSLRLLRQGSMVEIIFIRKPPLNLVVSRLQHIFEQEGLLCDTEGARRLCEATWGISSRKEDRSVGGTCDGDMRGILVVGEWVACKLRAERACGISETRLTKDWIQRNILGDLSHGGVGARSLGRDNVKELCDRIFAPNASFLGSAVSSQLTVELRTTSLAEGSKRKVMNRLRELIASNSEEERVLTECFSVYPSLPYQDDNFLTKPSIMYDWLHFHDQLSSIVHGAQEWELAPYLPNTLLVFHDLFACSSHHRYGDTAHCASKAEDTQNSTERNSLFGPRAAYAAFESTKANRAALQYLQTQLTLPLHRTFRSVEGLAVELLPYVLRMLSPDVKPVVVGGSENGVASVRRGVEKEMVGRAVDAMFACGVKFERGRVDHGDHPRAGGAGSWVYRMEPGLDALAVFETAEQGSQGAKTRFAVRQVLEQERKREAARRETEARLRRMRGVFDDEVEEPSRNSTEQTQSTKKLAAERTHIRESKIAQKKDFFGRPLPPARFTNENSDTPDKAEGKTCRPDEPSLGEENNTWVTYHEGFSNAVRKGITLKDLIGFPLATWETSW